MAIFFPLQGFWNAIIYKRPQWLDKRQKRASSTLVMRSRSFNSRRLSINSSQGNNTSYIDPTGTVIEANAAAARSACLSSASGFDGDKGQEDKDEETGTRATRDGGISTDDDLSKAELSVADICLDGDVEDVEDSGDLETSE